MGYGYDSGTTAVRAKYPAFIPEKYGTAHLGQLVQIMV